MGNVINKDRALLDFSIPADYNTVCSFIEIMEGRYPFLSVTEIGKSILGKKLHMLVLGNVRADKSMLYVGAHHGAEWITTLILLRFVNEICEYYKASKQPFGVNLQNVLATRCLYIIPQLNPDGVDIQINGVDNNCVLYDRLMRMSGGDFLKWQANARGVDLNHNYDAGFDEYKMLETSENITAGATLYSGEYPFSEPETSALANFIRSVGNIGAVLTLHSAGEEIYCSSCGEMPEYCTGIAQKLAALSSYKLSKPSLSASYGGLTDWFIKEFTKPSFTIECGKGTNPLHQSCYYSIYAGIREMLFRVPLLI